MPLLSAEFKTNMAVKYEEAKIYARAAYKKATTRTPKEPKEKDSSPKKSMTMKEAYFKRMEKGTLRDDDTNPMDRMAAMRLVDAGLWNAVWKIQAPEAKVTGRCPRRWDAKETEKLYAAYNKIRAKDGHRHKAKNAKTRYPTVADFYRFFRLEQCMNQIVAARRWRVGAGSSPLGGAKAAASDSPVDCAQAWRPRSSARKSC